MSQLNNKYNQQQVDAAACAWQMQYAHSPDGSTFLPEMMSWLPSWNYDVMSKTWLCQSMCIWLKKNPAKFHPDPNWNDGALDYFLRDHPPQEEQEQEDEQQYEFLVQNWLCVWNTVFNSK